MSRLPELPDKYVRDGRTVLVKKEVADICRVSVRTVERWIENGNLPAIKLSEGTVRIPVSAFPKRDG